MPRCWNSQECAQEGCGPVQEVGPLGKRLYDRHRLTGTEVQGTGRGGMAPPMPTIGAEPIAGCKINQNLNLAPKYTGPR